MQIAPFELERYFAKHEFTARYLLSSSDCESLSMSELLALASPETLQMWNELKLSYTESTGHPKLREMISESYMGLRAEETLVVVPEEGIFLLMHALLKPGDHVVSTFPGYQSLYEVARSIQCHVSTWEPDEERGWYFDIDQLKQKLRANTRLLVVNFPHNPTGYLPGRDDFEAIIDLVRERGMYLLSDEMYRHLEIDQSSTLPSACEIYERAVSLSGLSKAYGLPGLRIGWLASQDRQVLQRVNELKDYTTICGSAPSEILAMIAVENKARIFGDQLARVSRNLKMLDEFFQEYQDCFQWNRPGGGSICFPRMISVSDTSNFCEELIQATGIMLVPSRQFQYGDHHVRMGFGRENMPEIIELFGNYLNKHFR